MFKSGLSFYLGQWERFTETLFVSSILNTIEKDSNILDVGFAGGWYLLDLIDKFNCYGLDNDPTRIDGTLFTKGEKSIKELWYKEILSRMTYWNDSILTFNTDLKFKVVMSISTIEHIYPTHYQNNPNFILDADIKAIDNMKTLVEDDGILLLTFPCGILKKECRSDNPIKDKLIEQGFVAENRNIIYYNEERINRIIGDWKIQNELYWGFPFYVPIEKKTVLRIKNGPSTLGLCTMTLTKGNN